MARELTESQTAHGVLEERRNSPGLLLALLGQEAMRRVRDALTAHNLSPRQFELLGLLHDQGAMGQRELGQAMNTDPSVLVTLLNPLESDGLLSRDRDPEDRRRHVVTLTPAGAKRLARSARAQREAENVLLAELDAAQREQLRDLLIAIRAGHAPGQDSECAPPGAADGC
jgi:DNA-binding MarR family transcriptional regulator